MNITKNHVKNQVDKNHLVSLQSVNINLTTPIKKKVRRRKPRQMQVQAVIPQQQAPMPNLPLLPNTLNQYLTGVPKVPFNQTNLPSGINFPVAFPNTFSRDTGVLFNNAPSKSLNDISAEMAQGLQVPSELDSQSNFFSADINKELQLQAEQEAFYKKQGKDALNTIYQSERRNEGDLLSNNPQYTILTEPVTNSLYRQSYTEVNRYSAYSNKQLNEIADKIKDDYNLVSNPIKRLSKANKISWFIENGYEGYLNNNII